MRISLRWTTWLALAASAGIAPTIASGQASAPDAPAAGGQAAPAPQAALQPMPAPDPRFFTAASPTRETVEAFLKASWGYDENRIFQVQGIQKTQVPGISRVTVLVEEKGSPQTQPVPLTFLTLPDGQHLVSNDEILPFGAHPFAANKQALQSEARGPSRGPAGSNLQLVEFSDFECPHCKEAEPTIRKLLADYPQAHFISQVFPLRTIHPEAEIAAETGLCVARIGGSDAFFRYTDAVYASQAQLTPDGVAAALDAAVKTAGADSARVKACVADPSTRAAVDASVALGERLGVNSTPTLFVNGRMLPLAGIPYDQLRKIVDYDIAQKD